MCVEVRGQLVRAGSFFPIWISRSELKFSGLVASVFAHWDISSLPKWLFLQIYFYFLLKKFFAIFLICIFLVKKNGI